MKSITSYIFRYYRHLHKRDYTECRKSHLTQYFSIKLLLRHSVYEDITDICLSFPVFAVLRYYGIRLLGIYIMYVSCCDISEEVATSVFRKLKLLRSTNKPTLKSN